MRNKSTAVATDPPEHKGPKFKRRTDILSSSINVLDQSGRVGEWGAKEDISRYIKYISIFSMLKYKHLMTPEVYALGRCDGNSLDISFGIY